MLYRYLALDPRGRETRGTAEAGSPADARALLRGKGLQAFQVEEILPKASGSFRGGWAGLSGRRLDRLAEGTRYLALLLRTGIPLAQALSVLSQQVTDPPFREVLADLAARVREGASFDQALSVHPRVFPALYVQVASAGALAGELPRVLLELSEHYVRQKDLRDRVLSALLYPFLMALVGTGVLGFLLAFVVPRVTSVLLEQGQVLPWPTELLLWASTLVTERAWIVLPVLLAAALVGARFARTTAGGRFLDRLMLGLPVMGDLYRKQSVARWAGTMSTLLGTGIPVTQALGIARGVAGSVLLSEEIGRLESESLRGSRLLPPAVGFVAGVGEEAGELDRVLADVSIAFGKEVQVATGRLTELLNPVLIVGLGLVVGFIVAAVLLPITDFSKIR
jgi:general secretion pathway protein F